MAHIVFATTGSLGDLHPFLAVGSELRQRGHRITVATTTAHRSTVEASGLRFRHMRPDPWPTPDFGRRFMDTKHGAEFVLRDYLSPAIRQSYDDLKAATADADLMVSQSLALAAPIVAETTGIPWLSAVFQPFTLFSVYDPPVIPGLPFTRNRLLAPQVNPHILKAAKEWTTRWVEPVFALRQELGLPPGGHPIYEGQNAPGRVLAMFSPLFGTRQPDWPTNTVQTGTALYDQPSQTLSRDLLRFLKFGPRTILFTLGASSCQDPGHFFEESLKTARLLGHRALIVTGRDDLRVEVPPALGVSLPYIPYAEVLPYVAAAVHSGGIGTSCLTLLARKPQLLVPFAHDQADNARRLERLGVARCISKAHYSASKAANHLRALLTNHETATTITRMAEEFAQESGAICAANAIEATLTVPSLKTAPIAEMADAI